MCKQINSQSLLCHNGVLTDLITFIYACRHKSVKEKKMTCHEEHELRPIKI